MDETNQNEAQELKSQVNILWIVLSVLAVIAITVGAGLFLFFPQAGLRIEQARLSSGYNEKRDFDPYEFVRGGEEFPPMEVPSNVKEEFSATPEEEIVADPIAEPVEDSPVTVVLSVKKPEPPKVTPVKKTPKTMKISVTVYWIQVGSYSDGTKAGEVRADLLSKDISSEIQSKSVNGKSYYRVRIGSFASKGEADRFLESIRTIKRYEDSYVVQTTQVKVVPVN